MLIQIENLPLARDARVRRQCRALLGAGYDVTVVCPRARGSDGPVDDRVRLLDYPAPPAVGSGVLAYLVEYSWSLVFTLLQTARAHRRERVDVIQTCNPPDLNVLVDWPFTRFGVRFVFDQHDPSPEVFSGRYDGRRGVLHGLLLRLERLSYAAAHHVFTADESLKQLATTRGGQPEAKVTVVANAPGIDVRRGDDHPDLRRGSAHLCAWLGVMGPEDGVEMIVRTAAELRTMGRTDIRFALIGDGEGRPAHESLARALGVESNVEFVGWLAYEDAFRYLSSAAVGLAAEPPNDFSHLYSMMKVMDYMAAELPVAAFDIEATRRSAADAGAYAEVHDPASYATLIAGLLDDPERRAAMARAGRTRFERELAWDHQQAKYLEVFDRIVEADGR